jgi:hypothetical protein
MTILLYLVGILALSIFVSWWFLLGLALPALKLPMLLRRARVLKVLASEYQYEFPASAPQAYTLNRIERETRSQKLRDEELATLFMGVMVNSLDPEVEEVTAFARRVGENAARLALQQSISHGVHAQLREIVTQKVGSAV